MVVLTVGVLCYDMNTVYSATVTYIVLRYSTVLLIIYIRSTWYDTVWHWYY